jgi:transposase
VKQLETDETGLEQTEQLSKENRIRKERDEGKTYREIAKKEHVSISQICRVLNGPKQKEEWAPSPQGDKASKVFSLLEKGRTLPQIVIELKLEPEIVKKFYDMWVELKQIDVNEPNLKKLDQKLESHISNHNGLDRLLEVTLNEGFSRRNSYSYFNSIEGVCPFLIDKNEGMEGANPVLNCVFCKIYFGRTETIAIENQENQIVQR